MFLLLHYFLLFPSACLRIVRFTFFLLFFIWQNLVAPLFSLFLFLSCSPYRIMGSGRRRRRKLFLLLGLSFKRGPGIKFTHILHITFETFSILTSGFLLYRISWLLLWQCLNAENSKLAIFAPPVLPLSGWGVPTA